MNRIFGHFWALTIEKGRKTQGEVGIQKPRMPPWDTESTIRIPIATLSLKLLRKKSLVKNE